jgi:hypothetical protein
MPLPDPDTFKRNTAPLTKKIGFMKFGSGYGSNMLLVLTALDVYWEYRLGAPEIRQRLLYNLWKVCGHWLKLKAAKTEVSELLMRRRIHVTNLQAEALAALFELNPNVAQAFTAYQAKKQIGFRGPVTSLREGYITERQHYVKTGKVSGTSVSVTNLSAKVKEATVRPERSHAAYISLARKGGVETLSLHDLEALLRKHVPGADAPVVFLNKIERLKHVVVVDDDGLCRDVNDVLMNWTNSRGHGNRFFIAPYAMNKYGTIFTAAQFYRGENVVTYDKRHQTYGVQELGQFNHSSILAGDDVICAGCIHFGWDASTRTITPGVLSSIDNASGHYRPNTEALRTCVNILAEDGVDVRRLRVADWTHFPNVVYYWGDDFLNGGPTWADDEHPTRGWDDQVKFAL